MAIDLYKIGLMGAYMSPFFILAIISYFIVKRIHTESVCFKCGEKQWRIEHEIIEDETQIIDRLIFKCVSCNHIRSEYTGRTIEKESEK